mmetsp:Transcript_26744/g.74928  ORF Transcript_26744/g.74928 Transcript_26744/m.74928 type:complete len:313 (-) Transcript_26744:1282-2220(-)
MHAIPHSTEEQLAQSPAILRRFRLGESIQFHLDARWASAAFLDVIEDVTIGIGQRQSIRGGREVPSESRLAVTVLAHDAGETDRVALHLAAAAGAILFREVARLHLIHQHEEVVGDELAVFQLHHGHRRALGDLVGNGGRRNALRRGDEARGAGEADPGRRVDHAQPFGRVLPVLATAARPGLGGLHELRHALLDPRGDVRANQAVTPLPRLDGVVDVAEGGRVADGPFGPTFAGSVLAVEAADANLPHDDLDAVRLAVPWRRHVFRSGRERFDAVASHEAMERGEDVVVFRKRQRDAAAMIRFDGRCFCSS